MAQLKLVIDIPDKYKDNYKIVYNGSEKADEMLNAIKNGKPLPYDATNGDVIKAMFPNGSYGTNGNYIHVFGVGGNGALTFALKWWNSPYKAGDTDGNS